MILCVTLNPCLDKTLVVPRWGPGDSVRGRAVREVVGGKGNNVARALTRLGRPARPVTFLGGPVGIHCQDLLRREDHLDPIIVATASPTRVILTVRTQDSPDQTAFFDPDPAVLPAEADALVRAVASALDAGGIEAVTLSGSSPARATHALYSDLIRLVRTRAIPVFLDTYGPALDAIGSSWPDAIQLNRREAAAHLRTTTAALSDDQVRTMLADWSRHGVRWGIVTDGPGAVFGLLDGRHYHALPPPITAVNPIGSGDCLMAGITDAWLAQLNPTDTLRHGIACAVANALVWDAGSVDPGTVRAYEAAIVVEAGPG
jgi:1-phosphofructokinase family hexose kinase